MAIDWDEYQRNLTRAGGVSIGPGPGAASVEQQRQQTRASMERALFGVPEDASSLPALGGLAGGVGAVLFPQSRIMAPIRALTKAAPVTAPLAASLYGSTLGTLGGTTAEFALKDKSIMSKEFAKRAASSVIENAFWDVGGNLAVMVGGKTFKVAKEMLSQKQGVDNARQAAQEWLSKRGSTLTKAQLTNEPISRMTETVLKGSPGVTFFEAQQAGVKEAINKGIGEVKEKLQTSDAFKAALSADEPLTRAAGENFQNLVSTARQEFSSIHRPFYDSLSKDFDVFVDMGPIKAKAKAELERLGRVKNVGSAAERKAVLDQIIAQDDFIELGAAHDLRSAFYGAAQDAKLPSGATSSRGQAFDSYAKDIEKSMDSVVDFSKDKLGNDLLAQYKQTQSAYRQGKEGLFNTTIEEAMSVNPSKVGKYIADLSESEKFTDLFKAVSVIDDVAKNTKDSAGIINDIKYNFIEANLGSADKAAKFSKKLNENPELRRSFYKMFRNEASDIQSILNAADFGLEKGTAASTVLRNRLASVATAGGTATAGLTLGYLSLPDEVKTRLENNLPQTMLAAGALIITPRMMAKASTSKEAMDAISGLVKASQQPKFGGAAAAKLVDQLNKSGIIDSEYISTVDTFFNGSVAANQSETPPETTGPINWDEYEKQNQQGQ